MTERLRKKLSLVLRPLDRERACEDRGGETPPIFYAYSTNFQPMVLSTKKK